MQEEDAFFWIDIFSVDENRAADPANALPQEWWSGTFMDASKFIYTPVYPSPPDVDSHSNTLYGHAKEAINAPSINLLVPGPCVDHIRRRTYMNG